MTQAEADALPIGSLVRCVRGRFSGVMFVKTAQDAAGCRLTPAHAEGYDSIFPIQFAAFNELKARFTLETLPDLCLPVRTEESR